MIYYAINVPYIESHFTFGVDILIQVEKVEKTCKHGMREVIDQELFNKVFYEYCNKIFQKNSVDIDKRQEYMAFYRKYCAEFMIVPESAINYVRENLGEFNGKTPVECEMKVLDYLKSNCISILRTNDMLNVIVNNVVQIPLEDAIFLSKTSTEIINGHHYMALSDKEKDRYKLYNLNEFENKKEDLTFVIS